MGIKMLNIPNIVTEEEEKAFFELVASNIKRIRKEKKLSQLEVALCIGQKAPGFYANMENNAYGKHFNLSHLFRLSKLFDTPIEAFFSVDSHIP